MSVLIVDDSAVNRRVLEATLRIEGFKDVIAAASAEQALGYLGANGSQPANKIDVILMDVMMPGIDGFEACRRIKQAANLADIPVIIVTSMAEAQSIEAAFEAGASDYISRPISRVQLHARLKLALALKREREARLLRERELVEVTKQLERANRQLTELTRTDALTGVSNRRHFDEMLDQECRRCRRATHTAHGPVQMSLLMVDVDHFKLYNDEYGHPRGDLVLKRVAGALKAALRRPADFLARYGGEEFVVVLPETPAEGAAMVAERLRQAVVALGILHKSNSAGPVVTVSIGCSSSAMPDPRTLLTQADLALYDAKHAGRNCARFIDADDAPEHMETTIQDANFG